MKSKKIFALVMACVLGVSALAGCSNKKDDNGESKATEAATDGSSDVVDGSSDDTEGSSDTAAASEIKDWTFYACMSGKEINDGNEIQEKIAELTGVRVKETWMAGQEPAEAIGAMIVTNDLPDFIDGGDASDQLVEAGVLVPWDDYIEKYPNLKEMYTDKEWELFRKEDGHIYWANVFGNTYGESQARGHNDEAFWIQNRVLAWDNYPKIETLDEYFDLLKRFAEANPENEDGVKVIPYTALCEGWRYFCVENAPEFLDGYPNDGSVIVQLEGVDKPTIVDYNTTPTAKMYFKKLNEVYNAGLMDQEFATMSYDDYIAKLATGAVLGMCDQWWDFAYTVNDKFKASGYDEKGYNYVPLGLVAEKGMKNHWHTYGDTLNSASGICVTTKCDDPDKAFEFLSRCLDQEILDLRFWGIKDVDYLVDDNGMYYRTQEMRDKWADENYQANHICSYSYFPQYNGTSKTSANAMKPEDQESEFFDGLAKPLQDCFKAYGYDSYDDFLQSEHDEMGFWYPMYSYSNLMSTMTEGGAAWTEMGECKHEWLPKVITAKDFDSAWADYMEAYEACNPQAFLDEMQEELDHRVELSNS
ncbi:MAG: sugar ABC transporter substrate-binding protein [Clostridiales bacterium]|nr:sugar ABC transporter substrate-binding protein [Clostridiales bacterium]